LCITAKSAADWQLWVIRDRQFPGSPDTKSALAGNRT
jgi:hypothetical protein